jgi:putative transposase
LAETPLADRKKNAKRLGAHIVFIDESGFLLIPPVRKTWAPKGITPIVKHHLRRDRLSVISGVTVSPKRRRLGLYFQIHNKNIRQEQVIGFLKHLLRHLHGHLILVWDNGRIHLGKAARYCLDHPRMTVERLPAYAPELNPDEGVWSQAKKSLANGRPDTTNDLRKHLVGTLRNIRNSQRKLRACIRRAELPLFLK